VTIANCRDIARGCQVPMMDIAGRRPLLLFPMLAMILDLALITVCRILQVSTTHSLHVMLDNWARIRTSLIVRRQLMWITKYITTRVACVCNSPSQQVCVCDVLHVQANNFTWPGIAYISICCIIIYVIAFAVGLGQRFRVFLLRVCAMSALCWEMLLV